MGGREVIIDDTKNVRSREQKHWMVQWSIQLATIIALLEAD